MKCNDCDNYMENLDTCKFCHFESNGTFHSELSTQVKLNIANDLVAEQEELIELLVKENDLLKQALRELL